MALISFFDDPIDFYRPSRIANQHFGLGLDDDDFLTPIAPRRARRSLLSSPYLRPWLSHNQNRDQGSTISQDKDKFQVSLDVQQFSPEEITVKATGEDTITVEGKHEEKQDEHGYISRHFVRRYTLPKGHNIDAVQSKLSSDGVLTITAPRDADKQKERQIPIAITGVPSKAIENGGEQGQGDHGGRVEKQQKQEQAKKGGRK